MPQGQSRYRALETFAETVAALEVGKAKSLPALLDQIKGQAISVLRTKYPPRNEKLSEARVKARTATIRKAQEFRKTILPHVAKARKDGAETTREIADWLNKHKIKTARGFDWSSSSVYRLIEGAED